MAALITLFLMFLNAKFLLAERLSGTLFIKGQLKVDIQYPNSNIMLALQNNGYGINIDSKCLQCICELESAGCSNIGCVMDEGSYSCGWYQIKLVYYQDCGTPGMGTGENIETAWKRCAADKACSEVCIQNYVNRYAFNCPEKQGCELVSRIHNSGPRGCQTTRSDWYWNKIQYCLRQKKFENYFLEMIQSRSPPNSASTFFNPIQNSPLLLRVPSGPFNSDFTYYNDAGYGACGTVINAQTEMLIAVSYLWFTNPNPNKDPLCKNTCVKAEYHGKSIIVPVKDKCPSCSREHMDLSLPAFQALANPSVGHVYGATFTFVPC